MQALIYGYVNMPMQAWSDPKQNFVVMYYVVNTAWSASVLRIKKVPSAYTDRLS
jgi:hypothetical protein